MRKFAVAVPTVLAACAVAAPALAAGSFPPVTAKPTVTPNTAGTPAHPQSVKLRVQLDWKSLGSASQPIVTNFKVLFPKGSLYNGGKYTSCPLARISIGPSACPKGSIVGTGTGVAYAGQAQTHPTITVVNGGASKVWFYTVLNNPAHVAEPIVGNVVKLHGGPWTYSLSASVPKNLQIVAGTPVELTQLVINAGKGDWLATTACPGGHYPFSVTTGFVDPNSGSRGSSSDKSSIPCHS